MSKDKAIIPIEQREIDFYDDKVTAVVDSDGTVYVPVKPLCELIGIGWDGQRQRINRDPILSEMATSASITLADVPAGSDRPKTSHMIALPLDALNGWLFGVSANRVDESIRDDLLRYQRECYKVLSDAFSPSGIAVRADNDIMQSTEETAVTFRTLVQLAKIAREHYYMGQRLDEHDEKLSDHTKRLGLIEAQLSNPSAYITQGQAQQISEAVKVIAGVLSDRSGRNEYGGVYGELYRRYSVPSYKQLPAAKFETVMTWLREWFGELTDGGDVPF